MNLLFVTRPDELFNVMFDILRMPNDLMNKTSGNLRISGIWLHSVKCGELWSINSADYIAHLCTCAENKHILPNISERTQSVDLKEFFSIGKVCVQNTVGSCGSEN